HPEVTAAVSAVSAVPAVRQALVDLQREMARPGGLVMDGRDIGSVVLPDADRKFFVTAALDERARRRHKELAAQGHAVSLDEVRELMARRDRMDSTRPVAPLVQPPDAVVVDTTGRTVDEVVQTILGYCRRS
ncbi:MAG: (d)CMP kinase, partial [Bacillota bacterium]